MWTEIVLTLWIEVLCFILRKTERESREALDATNADCDASDAILEWIDKNPDASDSHPELLELLRIKDETEQEFYRTHPSMHKTHES